jgi:hypothetical protein
MFFGGSLNIDGLSNRPSIVAYKHSRKFLSDHVETTFLALKLDHRYCISRMRDATCIQEVLAVVAKRYKSIFDDQLEHNVYVVSTPLVYKKTTTSASRRGGMYGCPSLGDRLHLDRS